MDAIPQLTSTGMLVMTTEHAARRVLAAMQRALGADTMLERLTPNLRKTPETFWPWWASRGFDGSVTGAG